MDIQTKTDIIHQKIYDFLLYIYPLLTKYPKYEKFSLQTATRNAILEMLQEVIKWDKTATKSHLYTVDTALQESKELLRLAHDLKYSAMNARHYGESCPISCYFLVFTSSISSPSITPISFSLRQLSP